MKHLYLLILFGLSFGLISPSTATTSTDPFQRYVKIKNNLPFSVYPVIQSPIADNGPDKSDGRVARIFVNQGSDGQGVPPGQTVMVNIPKNGVGPYRWYQSERILLFTVNPAALEKRVNDAGIVTNRDNPSLANLCPQEPKGSCWSGIAKAAYWLDSPAQIIEYTVMSKDWSGTNKDTGVWPNADDPRGVPYIDIDVSYVDDVYLPVSMTLDDTGATKYMGTNIGFKENTNNIPSFLTNINGFANNPLAQWQTYGAYSAKNWPNNKFNDMGVPRSPHIPTGYNITHLSLGGNTSPLYTALPPPGTPAQCGSWPGCSNLAPDNLCCPVNGTMLSCCGLLPYLIDNTSLVDGNSWNPSLDALLARWTPWISGNPCADIKTITTWPSDNSKFDKTAFCKAFQATVQWVWNDYKQEPYVVNDCKSYTGNRLNVCIIGNIIGFTTNPNKDKVEQTGQLPESVQALLRNLPWGDGNSALQYQWDKFLHYWAPVDSIFNLDPVVTLIKNQTSGIGAMSGYSFSIDDQWGNYQDLASGFIVNVGPSDSLLNQESFDPYQQYRLSLAAGWDHATVCGRPINLNSYGQAITFSFWNNGQPLSNCDIVLYPKPGNDLHVNFRLVEYTASIEDQWTGLMHDVKGFKVSDPTFCASNSSPTLKSICDPNQTKLEPKKPSDAGGGLEVVYVSVNEGQRPVVSMTVPQPPK